MGGHQTGFVPFPFTSVGQAFSRGIGLYLQHFTQILGLTLVVYGPVQLLKNVLVYNMGLTDLSTVMRIDMAVNGVLGCLLAPAIIFLIVEPLRTGSSTTLKHALGYGVKRWGETFSENLVAGFLTLLAALLLLIPGIIVALWYAFINQVVALENRPRSGARERSKEIGQGHKWKMLGAFLLVGLIYVPLVFVSGVSLALADNWITATFVDLLCDVTFPMFSVVGLVMYLCIVHGDQQDSRWVERVRWAPRVPLGGDRDLAVGELREGL